MSMRLTGIASGMDTDTMVKQLVRGHQSKVDDVKGKKQLVEWKKEAWSALNTKLYDFYTGALSDFKSAGTYKTKKATSSDASKVTFNNSANAVTGTHQLSVKSLAQAAYLTGAKISNKTSQSTTYDAISDGTKTVDDLVDANGNALNLNGSEFTITDGDGKEVTLTVNAGAGATLDEVTADLKQQLQDAGITDLDVSFKDGTLSFVNNSATEKTEDGKTTYEGGTTYTIKGNDTAKTAFGLSDDGLSVKAKTDEKSANTGATGVFARETVVKQDVAVSGSTKLSDLGIAEGTTFTVKVGGKEQTLTIDKNLTVSDLAKKMSSMGVSANYDANQGRFYIAAASAGKENDFEITSSDATALSTLGIDAASATRIEAKDATVVYNDVEYTQSSNTFSINGLNFTATGVTDTVAEDGTVIDNPMTISVENDTQAAYDKVKEFVKEYNALIEEMNKLYNAENASDYKPLTDEEKEEMSEKDIENWENKIKDSILRRDDTINDLLSTMRRSLSGRASVTLKDGTVQNMSLYSLGINTGSYAENGKLHIYGDTDDAEFKDKDNELMKMLQEDPSAVMQALSGIGTDLYTKFQKAMKGTNLSSALTFYNDKEYDNQMDEYEERISVLQERLMNAEDKYYSQFSSMEAAMAKMQSQMSYISSMLG